MKNWAKNGRIPGKTLLSGIVLLIAQIHVIALADQRFGQKLVQFQGVTNLTFVMRIFQKTQALKSIKEFTMVKRLMNVKFVTKYSQNQVIWFNTEEYIREKSHILVNFVIKVLRRVRL